jgi:hypothetical protein
LHFSGGCSPLCPSCLTLAHLKNRLLSSLSSFIR